MSGKKREYAKQKKKKKRLKHSLTPEFSKLCAVSEAKIIALAWF